MTRAHTGGCLCAEVRYEAIGEPELCIACHCHFCQKLTGSAHAYLAYFPANRVTITGPVRRFVYESVKTGRVLTLHFCPTCGVNVAGMTSVSPEGIAISIGTLDESNRVSVHTHIRASSKHHSIKIPLTVDEYAEGIRDSPIPTRRATGSK